MLQGLGLKLIVQWSLESTCLTPPKGLGGQIWIYR